MIGESIGNFRIVSRLGMGGMGEVYLAEQETIRTKVAIKMLLPHVSANKEHIQRFFNEAIAASKIQHSGIVKIFDVGFLPERQGQPPRAYLVMEFLDGETLAARIRRLGRLAVAQLGDIGRQISSVLDAVHKAGITHRDLKPDNIFLVPDSELASGERVKILDFGIAKLTGPAGGITSTSVGSMGTPAYMSPEQWRNSARVDWRADAYSLGCLAFEMATGRPPFPADSIGEACTKHLTEDPPRLASIAPGLPAALDQLVQQLLAKLPEQRPASMKLIGSTFEMLGGQDMYAPTIPQPARIAVPPTIAVADTTLGGSTGARSQVTQPRGKRATVFASAVLAVGALAAGVAVIAGSEDTPTPSAALPPPASDAAASTNEPALGQVDAAVAIAVAPPIEPAVPTPPVAQGSSAHAEAPPSNAPRSDAVRRPRKTTAGAKVGGESADPIAEPKAENDLPEFLDRKMILDGIAAVKARARSCGSKVDGEVKLGVKVNPDGTVQNVSIRSTSDPALGTCVANAVRAAKFAKTLSGGAFTFPFQFRGGAAE